MTIQDQADRAFDAPAPAPAPADVVDVVDAIVGPAPGIDALRRRRPHTREQLQASFDALFRPLSEEHVTRAERELIAAFVTRATADDATARFYAERASAADPRGARVIAEAVRAAAAGPFGRYAEQGLQAENSEGVRYTPDEEAREDLGVRLAVALGHAHLLTFRPREARSADIDRLLSAGWSPDGVVTLSQLIAFLAFQQRVVAGLTALSTDSSREEIAA
ncbi:CMD domain protein [Microbacterium resistens]|uniref:CMD domain protein n=1 Tax=Microbacterium resistens TaxID=156977 RepID=A0ABU1S804_9MICO|nr:CMD domain protein [Microbacterium resistens]MDR6865735.1 CMD domain protein [Microbacterium resistens]